MKNQKFIIINLIVYLLIIIGGIYATYLVNNTKIPSEVKELEYIGFDIERTYIYGRNFNLEGNIKYIANDNIDEIILEINKIEYPMEFTINDNNIEVRTSNLENQIILDKISIGNFEPIIKLINNEGKIEKYRLQTDYKEDFEYYTITKNNKNNIIKIDFNNTINISVKNTKLPNDVYDIIIDPGHGGSQPGAVYEKMIEKEWNLKISKYLQKVFEEAGFKVKLTRTGDYDVNGKADPYGNGGRVATAYETKAKYFLSIHLNSYEKGYKFSGVEIYSSNFVDQKLAQFLVNNIVTTAKTQISDKNLYKIKDGIYVRNFTESDCDEFILVGKEKGYEGFTVYPTTPYYFMIRETGGIITNAFKDGRDYPEEVNPYRDSKIGVEGYLLELGFMPNSIDRKNIQNNYDKYAEGIVKGLIEYLND